MAYIKECLVAKARNGYELLPGPFLGICSKSPQSVRIGVGHVMERHSACTWLDMKGAVHCTCIGATRFRFLSSNRAPGTYFMNGGIKCNHVYCFAIALQTLAYYFNTNHMIIRIAISTIVAQSRTISFSEHSYGLPQVHSCHGGTVRVVVIGQTAQPETIQFVPVRRMRRGKMIRYVCAFCDLHKTTSCVHTETVSLIGEEEREEPRKVSDNDIVSFSSLPLSPVNCPRSIQVDQEVCSLAKEGKYFVVTAPLISTECGHPRAEKSLTPLKDGLIMCTLGPCKMQLNTYRCSQFPDCHNVLIPEGREHCIIIESSLPLRHMHCFDVKLMELRFQMELLLVDCDISIPRLLTTY